MKVSIDDILKEQTIEEFSKKGLDGVLGLFMATYPEYPYTELPISELNKAQLKSYDLPFLISYIRYSDIELLQCGIRDEEIKEKLYFLHTHIGTISASYRNFIWSEIITIDDLQKWLPLFLEHSVKQRILRTKRITNAFKNFLDECLDKNSYAYQNILLLNQLYQEEEIDLAYIAEQGDSKSWNKFLNIICALYIKPSFVDLGKQFCNLKKLLEQIKVEELEKYQPMINDYLKDPFHYQPLIETVDELKLFCKEKEKKCMTFLKDEYDIRKLKDFISRLFLGMAYREFEYAFFKIAPSNSPQYKLLEQFYKVKFATIIKDILYPEFTRMPNIRDYLEKEIVSSRSNIDLGLKNTLFSISPKKELLTLQGARFSFITMDVKEYQDKCVRSHKKLVEAEVQTDTYFDYQEKKCLLSFDATNLVSYDGKSACILKGKKLEPNGIIVFDQLQVSSLTLQKALGLPIVLIETESYAKENRNRLDRYYAEQNWQAYINLKHTLFESIKNHPWLFHKYFREEKLYDDYHQLQRYLTMLEMENVSSTFLKELQQKLEQLEFLNKEIEKNLEQSWKMPFQYKKMMIQ